LHAIRTRYDGTPHLGNMLCCAAIWIDAKCAGTLIDDRNYNGPGAIKAFADLAHLIPEFEAKYADKNPKHYTIADSKR
jgi:hypothetical protein